VILFTALPQFLLTIHGIATHCSSNLQCPYKHAKYLPRSLLSTPHFMRVADTGKKMELKIFPGSINVAVKDPHLLAKCLNFSHAIDNQLAISF